MTEQDQVEFREPVRPTGGRSLPVRIGIVAGAAALFVVGAVAAMGASPSPATSTDPGASAVPGASESPSGSAAPNASGAPKDGSHERGFKGGFGFGFGFGGELGRFGGGGITITAISGSNVTLKTDDGWTRTIAVTDATTITKGGATITLADLAVDDQVRFAQTRNADGTYTVTAIRVVLPTVVGQVKAVSGDTITVTQPGGTTATIHVDGSTTYSINGATGSLSDVKVGAFIVAEGTQRTDGSLDAAAVKGGDVDGRGFRGPGFPHDKNGKPGASASPAPSSNAG